MLLTQTGEYALRAMAILASSPGNEPVPARALSQATDISPHYLSKVLRRLVLAGLLVSRKGRGGGFTLARTPSEIRFVDVLAAVDAYPYDRHCVFGWGACNENAPCSLHDAWLGMSEAIRDWAANTSLAEVRADRRERPSTR
jgi:Rrf2 family iron-sulfur cluster assembly transcriptional regulator